MSLNLAAINSDQAFSISAYRQDLRRVGEVFAFNTRRSFFLRWNLLLEKFNASLLFSLARAMRRSEVAHSSEMKSALTDPSSYATFRAQEVDRVAREVETSGIELTGQTVLDFGCFDGALTARYLSLGAASVFGADIDATAVEAASARYPDPRLRFLLSRGDSIPLPDSSVDVVISYDVFEHVARPEAAAKEILRLLKRNGRALIGTQGWGHPFAPHLWSTMPVPWAHLVFSEATLLAACRRVYTSSWYSPNMHDFDRDGRRIEAKYMGREISREYLNHYFISDYETLFRSVGFHCGTRLTAFSSPYASWTRLLLGTALREMVASYAWFTLTKP